MPKIGLKQLVMYAGASGDLNPIHYDFEIAKNSGFPKPIVHGMLSAALCVGQAISKLKVEPTKIKKVKAKFIKPVIMDENIDFKISSNESNVKLYLLKENGEIACECEIIKAD